MIVQGLLFAVFNFSCSLQILIQFYRGGVHFCTQLAQLVSQCAFKACGYASSLFIQHCLGQVFAVSSYCRQNILVEHIQHGSSFDRNGGAVVFQQDFYTGFNLSLSEDVVFFKQLNVLSMSHVRQSLRSRFEVQQAAFCSFSNPFIGVTVAIEDNAFVSQVGFFNQIIYCSLQVRSVCQLISKLFQLFGYDGVQYDVRTSNGEHAAQHTEFKFVASEGKRRGSVSIGVILNQSRDSIFANLDVSFGVAVVNLVSSNCFQNSSQLSTQENGYNCRRSFVSTQAVVIASAGNRYTQQILVFINSLDDGCQEGQKAQVFVRLLARIQQVEAFFGRQGPVVVLAAAVYAIKGFFMQQANQAMTQSNTLHEFHHQLVVVRSNVGGAENRSQLVLCRSNLVMLGLCQYAKLPQLVIQVLHEGENSLFDDTKVMVIQLLATRRFSAKQGTAGVNQVFTFFPHFFVNQEIFLFGTNGAVYADGVDTKDFQQLASCFAGSVHGTQKRSLFIQHFAGVGAEGCRNAQAVIFNKSVGSGVPCSIAAGFKGSTQAAGREAGSIRLALDQFLAGKVHDYTAFSSRSNKAFMLFCGNTGHWLEPMGKVGAAVLQSPILHSISNNISNFKIQRTSFQDCCFISFVGCSR